jgi:hypothetical protein
MAAGGGSGGGYVDSRRWFFVLSLLFPLFFLSVFWFLIFVLFYFSSLSLVLLAIAHGAANGEWEEADNGSRWLLQWRAVFAAFFFLLLPSARAPTSVLFFFLVCFCLFFSLPKISLLFGRITTSLLLLL